MLAARTLFDLESCGFKCFQEEKYMGCTICPDVKFLIHDECFEKFDIVPMSFSNLKKSLSRHLKAPSHIASLKKQQEKIAEEKKYESLNVTAGFKCGRAAYQNIKNGQPALNYEKDIFLIESCGGTVGELNHSFTFLKKIPPLIANEV